jgi:cell division protein FtsB
MLSRFIVFWFKGIIELGLWSAMITGAAVGYGLGENRNMGILGLIVGALLTFIVLAIVFGAILILADIHTLLKELVDQKTATAETASENAIKSKPTIEQLNELGIYYDGSYYYVREFKFDNHEDAIEKAKMIAAQDQ